MRPIFILLITFLCCFNQNANSQVLSFDGINDYVNLGPDAGDNVRSVEFWFKLDQPIDSTLSDFKMLCGRENSSSNINEWHVSFVPSGTVSSSGTIRFAIVESLGNFYDVISNARYWNANQWYHVAAVVDPVQGMMLFIDGVKQNNVENSYTKVTAATANDLLLGAQQNFGNRYFEGDLEDFHLTSNALYTSNFTPPCPDRLKTPHTIGIWNFNESSGNVIIDSSLNQYNGQLFGANRDSSQLCMNINLDEFDKSKANFQLYPNPVRENLYLESRQRIGEVVRVLDLRGAVLREITIDKDREVIPMHEFANGIYFLQLGTQSRKIIISH